MRVREIRKICQKALQLWGATAQIMMTIEEMAELTQALSKLYREPNPATVKNMLEEIADVEIMLEQMKTFAQNYSAHNVDRIIEKIKMDKIERLMALMPRAEKEKENEHEQGTLIEKD
jgi:hypothetical protein